MRFRRRTSGSTHVLLAGLLVLTTCAVSWCLGQGEKDPGPAGLRQWAFLIGEWKLVEKRYSFDGPLIQTNTGRAVFSWIMDGQRIQELQSLPRGDEMMTALHLFVFDPRSEEIEIARTDSGHYGFMVIIGTMSKNEIHLLEKHPRATSDVTRRFTYRRIDDDHFTRQLEFSTNKGQSWFVRSEWNYTRE